MNYHMQAEHRRLPEIASFGLREQKRRVNGRKQRENAPERLYEFQKAFITEIEGRQPNRQKRAVNSDDIGAARKPRLHLRAKQNIKKSIRPAEVFNK